MTMIGAYEDLNRDSTHSQTLSTENFTSGIKMHEAPPAIPA